jgi:hypothetical protein
VGLLILSPRPHTFQDDIVNCWNCIAIYYNKNKLLNFTFRSGGRNYFFPLFLDKWSSNKFNAHQYYQKCSLYTFCKIQNKLQDILFILIIIYKEFLVYIWRCCLYTNRDNSYCLRNEISNKNVWFYLNCEKNYLFTWTKSCYIVIYFIYLYFAIFQINFNTYTSNMDHHRWINSKFLIIGM